MEFQAIGAIFDADCVPIEENHYAIFLITNITSNKSDNKSKMLSSH